MSSLGVICLFASVSAFVSGPAFAFGFNPLNPLDPLDVFDDPLDKPTKELEDAARDGLEKLKDEGEKLVRKTFDEIGNAADDLKTLVTEGKCGGDICDAIGAVVDFQVNSLKGKGDILEETLKRFEDGKPLDALWHVAVDPVNNDQELAAQAAMKSSVIRAVGQVAAGVYGGPAGAAAYAAWLTYHSTDGDLELALRAGAISYATAYAMTGVKDVQGFDIVQGIRADEIAQRAAMSAAIGGAAVAISGGDQKQIEEALVRGAVMSVLRDSYRELTKSDLDDNLKSSKGSAYCLKADPESGLSCLPEKDAYIRNADGSIKLDSNGSPRIDITKLNASRPHLGTWSSTASEGLFGTGETSGFMTGLSRIPGANAMSLAHDIFDDKFNPETNFLVEYGVRVGTIAPFVVMTYEGAGYRVQEMIRDTTQGNRRSSTSHDNIRSENSATENRSEPSDAADNGPIAEIRHLLCKNGTTTKSIMLEKNINPRPSRAYREKICVVDQLTHAGWMNVWHAHFDTSSCISKFDDIVRSNLAKRYTCYASIGLKYRN